MEQKLIEWGFVYVGDCNCAGMHNRKFKRGEYLVYLTPTKYKVKRHGYTIKGYALLEKMEEYFKAAIPGVPA